MKKNARTRPAPGYERFQSVEAMSEAAARMVVAGMRRPVGDRRLSLLLSGGSSPARTYELLAGQHRSAVRWDQVDVFFSDERCVPPTDARNNFAMARDRLLAHVPVPTECVHPIPTVGEPPELAARYDALLRQRFPEPGAPTFDLAIMGMGADGHTASLFPGDPALRETGSWSLAVRAPAGVEVTDRITLTLPILNRSRRVLFIVSGKDKRGVADRVMSSSPSPDIPASLVRGLEETTWLLHLDA